MIAFVIVMAAAVLLIAMSLRADARFRHAARLPMQWSFSGEVNWTAPRRIALALLPGLGIVMLTAMAAMMQITRPRPGQEGLEAPVLVVAALILVGLHASHLWMVGRTLGGGK